MSKASVSRRLHYVCCRAQYQAVAMWLLFLQKRRLLS
jgi:hypothetical protein